jgi:hypothetical protein
LRLGNRDMNSEFSSIVQERQDVILFQEYGLVKGRGEAAEE